MSAITGQQARLEWAAGDTDRAALYALRDVSTGDTFDLGINGAGQFLALKEAIMMGTTVQGTSTATVTGTVVTMPAGLSLDACYLLAWGDSAV
jgi:hypothetical protein